jgi:hypothetical protein
MKTLMIAYNHIVEDQMSICLTCSMTSDVLPPPLMTIIQLILFHLLNNIVKY